MPGPCYLSKKDPSSSPALQEKGDRACGDYWLTRPPTTRNSDSEKGEPLLYESAFLSTPKQFSDPSLDHLAGETYRVIT